jgi:hypothetical protein
MVANGQDTAGQTKASKMSDTGEGEGGLVERGVKSKVRTRRSHERWDDPAYLWIIAAAGSPQHH